ncbi:MAG: DEAD/DEAH box helicase [Candidatus Thermoplasmatota archaeon]|nr:DEAD/DEAH box helicase [Candidatus Thermoplasmatota archaeon]
MKIKNSFLLVGGSFSFLVAGATERERPYRRKEKVPFNINFKLLADTMEMHKSAFDLLDKRIRDILTQKEILAPTDPQQKAIPEILAGKNTLLIAPTGMGKTEAAVLPVFHKYLNEPHESKGKGISIIYITPLRALNRDLMERLVKWGEKLGIEVAVRHGDTPQKERNRQSSNPPDMLITTPETMQVLFLGSRLREHLKHVKFLVIDEIHELATDERGAQLAVAMERLVALKGEEFQRIGLSATVGTPDAVGAFLAGVGREISIIKVPVAKMLKIHVEMPEQKKEDLEIMEKTFADAQSSSAIRRCKELIESHRSTLFFVNTRDGAEILAARFHLLDEKFPIGIHHGSLSKEVRMQMENEFKTEKLKGLICTSSLELGIDVGSADFTIQYNSPRQVTRLIQRAGRAGHRVGGVSEAAIIATNTDDILESMVTAKMALHEELEPLRIRECPNDVLANQIAAFSLAGEQNAAEVFAIFKRVYSFRNLAPEKFLAILRQLAEERIIWMETEGRTYEERMEAMESHLGHHKQVAKVEEMMENGAIKSGIKFGKRKSGMMYFYDNISMIPDEKTYRVLDLAENAFIGTLDESFVVNYGFPGARFIMRGRSWEVVDSREDRVMVQPCSDMGAIPSWVGEELPVTFEVAQEVGRLRRHMELEKYPGNAAAKEAIRGYVGEQKKKFPVPDDRTITIESGEGVGGKKIVVVNSCVGNKVNETIGQLLGALMTARMGSSIGVQTDPYRIIFETPLGIDPQLIHDYLTQLSPDSIEDLLKIVLRNSSTLRWMLVHVARKFGALSRDVDFGRISMNRLIGLFERMPLYEEALKKVLWEKMDIEGAKILLGKIKKKEIEIKFCGLSPMGIAGYEQRKQLITPEKPDRAILTALKSRLEEQRVDMACVNCHHKWNTKIANIDERPRCPKCKSLMVAAVRENDDSLKLLKRGAKTDEEDAIIKRLRRNAGLVATSGKRAIIAMAARGVGPDTASRILEARYDDEYEFLKAILKAEINYARTRRFWD